MKQKIVYFLLFVFITLSGCSSVQTQTCNLEKYGLKANRTENASPVLAGAIQKIMAEHHDSTPVILRFEKGVYHFYPTAELEREYYISNHDQNNPKQTGIPLEGLKNIVLDGQGSQFIFHGRMLPVSIVNCENCVCKNFSVDFDNPHIIQFKVLHNDTLNGKITFEVAPWVKYKIENDVFIACGEGWQHTPYSGIAFNGSTRHIVFNTSDLRVNLRQVKETSSHVIVAENMKNPKLVEGTVIAGRTGFRPTPGIFIHHSTNTRIENVKVHYAEGMGLLAQLCDNITLDGFGVCLKGKDDPRYFTTQADATHFSGCKGKIVSVNGLYEGMMDDAINVHGTYLKVTGRPDDNTLTGSYMHPQSWGFDWGYPGDTVQFIHSTTMELTGKPNTIVAITPIDKPTSHGAKMFRIQFSDPLPPEITPEGKYGIENLTWTPEVLFSHNTIRNNRARGTLFSTPKKTMVSDNLFDHTSGSAILLCGDCNGWYETGACRNVQIRNNRFVNSLTNLFQFTNAVISIYPEIPDLTAQQKLFHGIKGEAGIVIEGNRFETFDAPLLYAKSVQGLIFRNNTVIHNHDFPAFHRNKYPFFFEKAADITILNNSFDTPFDPNRDIRLNLTPKNEIHIKLR